MENSTYQPDYNTRLVALLSYLDDTETVSLQEVYRLVAMVTAAPDQEGLADLAEAIVNNYYSKGLFIITTRNVYQLIITTPNVYQLTITSPKVYQLNITTPIVDQLITTTPKICHVTTD